MLPTTLDLPIYTQLQRLRPMLVPSHEVFVLGATTAKWETEGRVAEELRSLVHGICDLRDVLFFKQPSLWQGVTVQGVQFAQRHRDTRCSTNSSLSGRA